MDFPGIFSSGWIAKAVNRGRFLDSLSTNSGNWKRVDIFVCLEMRGPQNLLGRSSNSASWFWFLEGFYVGNRQQKVDFHPWVCRQNHFLQRFMGTRTSSPKSTPLIFSWNWEGHHPEIETEDHLNVVFGDLNGTSEPTVGSLCPPSTESTGITQKLCHLFMKEFWLTSWPGKNSVLATTEFWKPQLVRDFFHQSYNQPMHGFFWYPWKLHHFPFIAGLVVRLYYSTKVYSSILGVWSFVSDIWVGECL